MGKGMEIQSAELRLNSKDVEDEVLAVSKKQVMVSSWGDVPA